MESFKPYVSLAARVLLALIFVIAGYGKLGSIEGTQGYMAMVGLPGFLVWPTIALELLGGLALIAGFQTRLIALALAGFTLVAGALFHFQPADQMQMIMFWKNIAITGGLLLLAVQGAGAMSVDARLGAKPALA